MNQDQTRLVMHPETDQREEQILSTEVKTVSDLGKKCFYLVDSHAQGFCMLLNATIEYKLKRLLL